MSSLSGNIQVTYIPLLHDNLSVTLDPQTVGWRTWGEAQAEAQMMLDDIALQIPKSEPIEPTLTYASL